MSESVRSPHAGDRPAERRGDARTAVVWEALRPVLDGTADVLDIGGGTGGFAVRVAELGHRVSVVDPSPDALAALDRRARERGVTVAGQQGDLSTLLEVTGPRSADVVLCHGVLEVVDDPAAALATLREVLRPDGTLSLLVAQLHAAVVARAMAGHFGQALTMLAPSTGAAPGEPSAPTGRIGHRASAGPARRFTHAEAAGLLTDAGFEVTAVHGVRVFADLVPGSLLDVEPGATGALVELERAVSERPEYLPLATQLHLLAR
jgi:S-adenosylmethionine-dependent methyltransferase